MQTERDTTAETGTDRPQLPQTTEARNPGMALDMNWVRAAQANPSAIERRAHPVPV